MTTRLLQRGQAFGWTVRRRGRFTIADSALVGGEATFLVGVSVLLGWALGSETLKFGLPGLASMKANTALCFILMGGGIVLCSASQAAPRRRSVGLLLIAVATVIALATMAQYVTGVDLGIDQLAFRDPPGSVATMILGRMSPVTAICLVMLGVGGLAVSRARRAVAVLGGVALMLALLNVFDFVFNAAVPAALTGYTAMAPATALATAMLAIAVIGLIRPVSPLGALSGNAPTAVLLRRLLLAVVVAPVVTAWLSLEGVRLGLYDASFGTALMLVGTLTLGVGGILGAGRWARSLERARSVVELERDRFFELSLDLMVIVGADGVLRRVNGAWQSALGYRPEELVGKQMFDFVHPDDLERTVAESNRDHTIGEPVHRFRNRYRHRNGTYRWFEWMSQPAPDRSVRFGVARDVTAQKRLEDLRHVRQRALETRNVALVEQAVRDPLTGLHNRRFFDEQVRLMEQRWQRLPSAARPPVSVAIFDLDRFGEVNNQHGHQAGDAVLRQFAELLANRFRKDDLVARYGGEEFVVVLEGAGAAQVAAIAESIRVALERSAIEVGEREPIRITVSTGCAQLAEHEDLAAGLFRADSWLAQAKRAGRNQVAGEQSIPAGPLAFRRSACSSPPFPTAGPPDVPHQ